jgi:predicted ester cyclase
MTSIHDATFAADRSQTHPTTTREQVMALVARRQDAFEKLDATTLAADYADDAVIQSPMAGVHHGREAEAAFRHGFNAFGDMTQTLDAVIIDGDRVAEVRSMSGTHVGEFLGLASTKKAFRLSMVFLYELKDGKIVHERRIYDFTGLLMQIGVLKVKPI